MIWWLALQGNYPVSGHMDIIASYVVEHFKVHGENDPKTEVILHELSSRTGLNGGRMIDLTRKPNGSYATDGLSRFLPFQRRSIPAVLPLNFLPNSCVHGAVVHWM